MFNPQEYRTLDEALRLLYTILLSTDSEASTLMVQRVIDRVQDEAYRCVHGFDRWPMLLPAGTAQPPRLLAAGTGAHDTSCATGQHDTASAAGNTSPSTRTDTGTY